MIPRFFFFFFFDRSIFPYREFDSSARRRFHYVVNNSVTMFYCKYKVLFFFFFFLIGDIFGLDFDFFLDALQISIDFNERQLISISLRKEECNSVLFPSIV